MTAVQHLQAEAFIAHAGLVCDERLRWDEVWLNILFTGAEVGAMGRLLLPSEMHNATVVETSMLSDSESSLSGGCPFIFVCRTENGSIAVAFRMCRPEFMPREALAHAILHSTYSYAYYKRASYDVPHFCVLAPRIVVSDYEEGRLTLYHGSSRYTGSGCTSFCFEFVDVQRKLLSLAALDMCGCSYFALPYATKLNALCYTGAPSEELLPYWVALCCKDVWDAKGVSVHEVMRLVSMCNED